MENRLVELLAAGDWRTAEVEAAAEPATAAPQILKLLLHEAPFDTPRIRVAFAETWHDGTITSFNMVLRGLLEAVGTHALDGLVRALNDQRWNVFEQAAGAVATLGPAGAPAASALVSRLSAENCRLRAIDTLGHIGSAARVAIPKLVALIEHGDPIVRSYAVTALARIALADPIVRDAIDVVSREDADPEVREVAHAVLD